VKTTIEIPDEIYRKVKTRAALQGTTIKDILVHSLQVELESRTLIAAEKIKTNAKNAPIRRFKKNLQVNFSKVSFRLSKIPEPKIYKKINFDPALFLQEDRASRNDLLLY
jgi:negative regulator of replication initiation